MRPMIPKRMELRIRTAKDKVRRARESIVYFEQVIIDKTAELALFERDPHRWIFDRWHQAFELDSYPVITAITGIRESLERRISRRTYWAIDLEMLEDNLRKIEGEVLAQVTSMRPSVGRVAWPSSLPPFKGYEIALDTSDSARQRLKEFDSKQLAKATTKQIQINDDGAQPGDGSLAAMSKRMAAWRSPQRLMDGRIRLHNGASFHVTAAGEAEIASLQNAIDTDQQSGAFGHTWNLACAIALSGCNWTGWTEWYRNLVAPLAEIGAGQVGLGPGMSLEKVRIAQNEKYDHLQTNLRKAWIPSELGNLEVFTSGGPVMPSVLYEFWRSAGFTDKIARNWFLKAQAWTEAFQTENNQFGQETWSAMINAGLVLKGLDIPLQRALPHFNLKELQAIMAELGLEKSGLVSVCHATLQTYPDEGAVKERLSPHGYENLLGVEPPVGLSWAEFQSWRQQIRGMAVAITDIYAGQPTVPQKVLDQLLV